MTSIVVLLFGGRGVDALLLARLQFGITTVHHFLFARVTIGVLAARGSTALVVTHRRALLGLADQIVRLENTPARRQEVVTA